MGIYQWEAVDGSHRVEAAKAFGWRYVDIAILGTDVPHEVASSFAMHADVEGLRQRHINFIDKVLIYTRLLEVYAHRRRQAECPSLTMMVSFGANEKMCQKTVGRSNLQAWHRIGRFAFRREGLKLALRRFSASLPTKLSQKLIASFVQEHWILPAVPQGKPIPSESSLLASFKRFSSGAEALLSGDQPSVQSRRRAATPGTDSAKKRRKTSRVPWADAVETTEKKNPVKRLEWSTVRAKANAAATKGENKEMFLL